MIATSKTLRSVPLFAGMTERSLEEISGLATEVEFPAGGVLVREGDPGDTFLVLLSGRAVVDQGGRQIREIADGDFLGEISLIDHGPRTATVTAIDPVRALSISCDGFGKLMDEYPPVRLEILSALTRRVRSTAPAASD